MMFINLYPIWKSNSTVVQSNMLNFQCMQRVYVVHVVHVCAHIYASSLYIVTDPNTCSKICNKANINAPTLIL